MSNNNSGKEVVGKKKTTTKKTRERVWEREEERWRIWTNKRLEDIGNLLELSLQGLNKHAISALFHVSQCALSCVVIFIKTIRLLSLVAAFSQRTQSPQMHEQKRDASRYASTLDMEDSVYILRLQKRCWYMFKRMGEKRITHEFSSSLPWFQLNSWLKMRGVHCSS